MSQSDKLFLQVCSPLSPATIPMPKSEICLFFGPPGCFVPHQYVRIESTHFSGLKKARSFYNYKQNISESIKHSSYFHRNFLFKNRSTSLLKNTPRLQKAGPHILKMSCTYLTKHFLVKCPY